jgi:beta-1,2-mannobiose phosphorylase / 1,2-beta-oligomannan phosphorylase
MSGFELQRLGMLMKPEPGNPQEVEGVLNPAAVRGPDGDLYLFPRLVAKGNYSRIGIARVQFNEAGDPCGVERLGIALEPEADYERRPDGGGCEDPRITFVEPLGHYMMTYTAHSSKGPRIALAMSEDLFHWQRLGLATFCSHDGIEFDGIDDKDAGVFPVAVLDPAGIPSLAMLHRPLFPGTRPEEKAHDPKCALLDIHRESIWVSYRPMNLDRDKPEPLCHSVSHFRLATPVAPWEQLKIGSGTPPVLTRHGWLMIYHGVSEVVDPSNGARKMCYAAGVMVLSKENPCFIRYRSPNPVLEPLLPEERGGIVSNVVFPTGIDRRDDLGLPDRFDVYYGMADNRIGVARLDVPAVLPSGSFTEEGDQSAQQPRALSLDELLKQKAKSRDQEHCALRIRRPFGEIREMRNHA